VGFDFGAGFGVVDPGAVDGCDDGAGADGVDADAVGGVLEGEGLREVFEAAFGHGVAEVFGLGDAFVDGGVIEDDTAAATGEEVFDGFAGAEEGAFEIDAEDAVVVGGFHLVGGGGLLDAGVVDEDVEGFEFAEDGGEHVAYLGLVGDVGGDDDLAALAIAAGGAGEAACFLGAVGAADVIDGDVSAFGGEADGDGLAYAGGGSGDENVSALEACGVDFHDDDFLFCIVEMRVYAPFIPRMTLAGGRLDAIIKVHFVRCTDPGRGVWLRDMAQGGRKILPADVKQRAFRRTAMELQLQSYEEKKR
jgi:hypothetical protein